MSLLTGQPRAATVVATVDCTVLELGVDAFRTYIQGRPEVTDELALAVAARQKELEGARSTAGMTPAAAATSLRTRMREYFGLG